MPWVHIVGAIALSRAEGEVVCGITVSSIRDHDVKECAQTRLDAARGWQSHSSFGEGGDEQQWVSFGNGEMAQRNLRREKQVAGAFVFECREENNGVGDTR